MFSLNLMSGFYNDDRYQAKNPVQFQQVLFGFYDIVNDGVLKHLDGSNFNQRASILSRLDFSFKSISYP
jgi:hypothetical protein